MSYNRSVRALLSSHVKSQFQQPLSVPMSIFREPYVEIKDKTAAPPQCTFSSISVLASELDFETLRFIWIAKVHMRAELQTWKIGSDQIMAAALAWGHASPLKAKDLSNVGSWLFGMNVRACVGWLWRGEFLDENALVIWEKEFWRSLAVARLSTS